MEVVGKALKNINKVHLNYKCPSIDLEHTYRNVLGQNGNILLGSILIVAAEVAEEDELLVVAEVEGGLWRFR